MKRSSTSRALFAQPPVAARRRRAERVFARKSMRGRQTRGAYAAANAVRSAVTAYGVSRRTRRAAVRSDRCGGGMRSSSGAACLSRFSLMLSIDFRRADFSHASFSFAMIFRFRPPFLSSTPFSLFRYATYAIIFIFIISPFLISFLLRFR
jgi:hypothetical protein